MCEWVCAPLEAGPPGWACAPPGGVCVGDSIHKRERHLPAFTTLFDSTAAADGSETGNQAIVAAALLATRFLMRRSLLVLHGSLALRRTILTLGRTILALRRTVLTLRGAVALQKSQETTG